MVSGMRFAKNIYSTCLLLYEIYIEHKQHRVAIHNKGETNDQTFVQANVCGYPQNRYPTKALNFITL
jgi:hypothetical protein